MAIQSASEFRREIQRTMALLTNADIDALIEARDAAIRAEERAACELIALRIRRTGSGARYETANHIATTIRARAKSQPEPTKEAT